MAIGNVWNIEWLNQNSQRNYPLSEEATGYDITGAYAGDVGILKMGGEISPA